MLETKIYILDPHITILRIDILTLKQMNSHNIWMKITSAHFIVENTFLLSHEYLIDVSGPSIPVKNHQILLVLKSDY